MHTPRRMKVGIELPIAERRGRDDVPRWTAVLEMAGRAEAVGFDSVWIEDHLLLREAGDEPQGVWDGWSILAGLAAVTSRVELGMFVACAGFRNPALIAKMADTIDEISTGRLILGLGAGWHAFEFAAFGFPFDLRVSRFEEAILIISSLLRNGQIDFAGRFHQAHDCELRPRGPRPGGPPILVGTTGERMVRITARYADLTNAACNDIERLPALNARIDDACRDVGRDPATLGRTIAMLVDFSAGAALPRSIHPDRLPPLAGASRETADTLRAFADAGVAHVQVTAYPMTVESVERLGAVLER